MGCGASKEDIAEPRPMQSHGRNKLHLKGNEAVALKPNEIDCALDGSKCICSLYNNIPSAELNNSPSPPSVFIHSPDESLSSDEDEDEDDEDIDPSFEFPSKLSVVEEDNSIASQTTALAALSGEAAVTDKELEERVEAILAADDGESNLPEESEECCALGVLSHSAILQALLSTGPVITQQFLGSDLSSARVIKSHQSLHISPFLIDLVVSVWVTLGCVIFLHTKMPKRTSAFWSPGIEMYTLSANARHHFGIHCRANL